MPFSPIVGAGVPGSDRLRDLMRGWRLHPISYGVVEVAGSIYVPPHASIEALREALPPSFRFVGDAGVEDPFAGHPFEQGPFLKCFLHAEDLCRPSLPAKPSSTTPRCRRRCTDGSVNGSNTDSSARVRRRRSICR
jgi:hypothetical protein